LSRRIERVSGLMAGPLSILHRACFPEDPWNVAAMTEIMGMAGFFGRIAWEDETPAGFALALDLREECEVLSLAVAPERRRSGVGSALLGAVCVEARLRGAEWIVLEVAADNIPALDLYAVHGFVQVGRRFGYYPRERCRVDALVLRLRLADTAMDGEFAKACAFLSPC
jgi:[ribosomal protein S18]-alanine N-acetyltransferase